ncbi:30S ribosomal protein S17 [Haloarcula sp. S1AR25-5A]|uniref:30S ribosomal protein S17 n=1 Tax=Haloarcula terrestris TaxID=2950533 RepID=A0AAE4F0Y2_9EURY|nr:30S ribosomal protein S17 [Haloarcula terrestris]MDS0222812.1 30S ribosomal protein S17 [Haloarcula terrestris]
MDADPREIIDTGDRLLAEYPELFTEQYETNTRLMQQLAGVDSFRIQIRLTGYITRKKRTENSFDR